MLLLLENLLVLVDIVHATSKDKFLSGIHSIFEKLKLGFEIWGLKWHVRLEQLIRFE